MSEFIVKPLEESTWQDFARLVEKHNGVWGGCWCLGFHQKGTGSFSKNKQEKKRRVRTGETHAALVYAGSNASAGVSLDQPTRSPGSSISDNMRAS